MFLRKSAVDQSNRLSPISQYLDDVKLETTIFDYSGSSPKPGKIVGQIESGLTEVYCIQVRRQDFAAGGHIFEYDIGRMQQPGGHT